MASKAEHDLKPVPQNKLLYSILIPAHNEENNIAITVREIATELRKENIPFEIVVVNDNSIDKTEEVVNSLKDELPELVLVRNLMPPGLGRAIRSGLKCIKGDVVAIVMADRSDDPGDVVRCYRKIEEGYDCVFGSRFRKSSKVVQYPPIKYIANRVVNKFLQLLFLTRFNDLTNAFKVYRRHVIESISPLQASHFNITIEMSLSALIRRYKIAEIPISWYGRTWGQSKLRLREMGRRYLCTMLMIWFERLLILDDIMTEKKYIDNSIK
ncbi:MAG: glycosyltransferase family 2 protein [Candidatus Hydrogenedentes bacterium]|nr:glycosyltransferase family 2 protein [Candidatus Hydrogenedentota bacterium]